MSGIITIHDRQFRLLLNEAQIAEAVARVADSINTELAAEFPVFLAVLNGSFMFASDLLKRVKIPCEITFVRLASYSGVNSSGTVRELLGIEKDIEDRTVVIVEDIIDSGLTLELLATQLQARKVRRICVATFLFKPAAYKRALRPDYVGFEVGDQFVVGYGMDYAGRGRNLSEVHVLA